MIVVSVTRAIFILQSDGSLKINSSYERLVIEGTGDRPCYNLKFILNNICQDRS
jgi:hypothetical protein